MDVDNDLVDFEELEGSKKIFCDALCWFNLRKLMMSFGETSDYRIIIFIVAEFFLGLLNAKSN